MERDTFMQLLQPLEFSKEFTTQQKESLGVAQVAATLLAEVEENSEYAEHYEAMLETCYRQFCT